MTRQITIEVDAGGRGSVMVDGEVLEGVRSVMLTAGVGQNTEVALELVGADVLAQVEGRITVRGLPLDSPAARYAVRSTRQNGDVVVASSDDEMLEWQTDLWDRNAVGYDPRESMV